MNQFDAAKLRAEKRQERQAKYEAPVEIPAPIEPVAKVPSKEPSTAAFIDVKVTLPDGSFSFRLMKQAIYQNAHRSRLNKNEFRNRIIEGLRPLLGGVIELPFGGN